MRLVSSSPAAIAQSIVLTDMSKALAAERRQKSKRGWPSPLNIILKASSNQRKFKPLSQAKSITCLNTKTRGS
jgi:hypothetical protein